MEKDKKLTQEQINELFGAVNTGGEAAVEKIVNKHNKMVKYDFNRPTKFKIENLKSLESIANSFARNFSQILAAKLRLDIKFQLNQEIEQIPYASEYIEKMPKNQFVFCVTDMGHEDLNKIVIQMDYPMINVIHKKLMGAKDVVLEYEYREMTDIEGLTMEEWVYELMFPILEESFNNIVELNLSISSVETDPQHVKITRSTDMIALIVYDVTINDAPTTMSIGIPYKCIEDIIHLLTTENVHEFRSEKDQRSEEETIGHHLKLLKRNIDVELGKTKITLKELLKFSSGDVLVLDKPVNEELVGFISNKPKFSCVMGREDNKVAVKITGFAEKEVIENE